MGVINGGADVNSAIEQLRPLAAEDAVGVCSTISSLYPAVPPEGQRALMAMSTELCNFDTNIDNNIESEQQDTDQQIV